MSAPQDFDADLARTVGIAAAVIRNKHRILEQFCERVQKALPGARASPHPVIIDTLPTFITRLALALSPEHREVYASQYSNIALQHGNERARFTSYSLKEVIKEYQFLREIISNVLRDESAPTPEEWNVVHRSIDEGIAEAAAAFVEVQEELRSLFTAALSHDFRGPLQTAINFIELLRRPVGDSERDKFAGRASDNLKRVDHMIVDLLDVSRTISGRRMSLELKECSVETLVRDVVDDVAARVGDRLRVDIAQPISAYLNEEKIRRALHNLVENALKYGRPDTHITTRAVESHGRLMLSVHNFGEPIPPAEQLTLFEPYRRARSADRSGKAGWGLGLALVQSIAQAHGGSVTVESTAEDGTTFTIDVLIDARDLDVKAPVRQLRSGIAES